jgi:hypothetical protein
MRREAHKLSEQKCHSTISLVRVHLLQPGATLVQSSVDSCSDGQGTANDGAYADQETGEGL